MKRSLRHFHSTFKVIFNEICEERKQNFSFYNEFLYSAACNGLEKCTDEDTNEATPPVLGAYANRMCDWAMKSSQNLNLSEDINIETFVGAIPMCHPVTCGFPASLWIQENLSGVFFKPMLDIITC